MLKSAGKQIKMSRDRGPSLARWYGYVFFYYVPPALLAGQEAVRRYTSRQPASSAGDRGRHLGLFVARDRRRDGEPRPGGIDDRHLDRYRSTVDRDHYFSGGRR